MIDYCMKLLMHNSQYLIHLRVCHHVIIHWRNNVAVRDDKSTTNSKDA